MRFILRRNVVDLDSSDVNSIASTINPEPILRHYVEVRRRHIPPKQLLYEALKAKGIGLERIDFTTMDARSILRRLGFNCKTV